MPFDNIDLGNRALRNMKQDAQDKIKTYREYLPTKEDLFQRGITVGSERIVGCVLKVKTKIRAKD